MIYKLKNKHGSFVIPIIIAFLCCHRPYLEKKVQEWGSSETYFEWKSEYESPRLILSAGPLAQILHISIPFVIRAIFLDSSISNLLLQSVQKILHSVFFIFSVYKEHLESYSLAMGLNSFQK